MTLDTQVFADPAGCRATGRWLRDSAERVHDTGTVLQDVNTRSEAIWTGEAGDAFREHLLRGRQDADELSWVAHRCGDALIGFADDTDTVITRMNQARAVAATAGLTVTPSGIEPPGPVPTVPAVAPGAAPLSGDIGSLGTFLNAATHQRTTAAWNEAQATVAEARELERGAHDTLVRRIRDEQTLGESIKNNSRFLGLEAALGTPAKLQHASNHWTSKAAGYRADAPAARAILDSPNATAAQRAQALRDFLRSTGQERAATRAATSSTRALGPLARSQAVGKVLDLSGTSIKGVPVRGVGVTAWQVSNEIAAGKPTDRAVASGTAGFAVGLGASAGFTSVASAVGIAGGPVTLGAVAIGRVRCSRLGCRPVLG